MHESKYGADIKTATHRCERVSKQDKLLGENTPIRFARQSGFDWFIRTRALAQM